MATPFVVIYDASVLYPAVVRDLLIRIGQAGLVQAKWTDEILDETFRSIRRDYPNLASDRLDRTRGLVMRAIRDCLVTQYEPLVDVVQLPDAGDRHVLAAAIKSRAQVIVTQNLKDFPADVLRNWNVEAKTADDFVVDQIHLDEHAVRLAVRLIADSWSKPPATAGDVLDRLERTGLVESATLLRY